MTDTTKMLIFDTTALTEPDAKGPVVRVEDVEIRKADEIANEADTRIAELEAYIRTATKAIQSRDEAMVEIVELEARLQKLQRIAESSLKLYEAYEGQAELGEQQRLGLLWDAAVIDYRLTKKD